MLCDSCSSFVQSCACTFLVLRCDVRYSFHIQTMFDSSLPPVVIGGLMSYSVFCVCLRIAMFNILLLLIFVDLRVVFFFFFVICFLCLV